MARWRIDSAWAALPIELVTGAVFFGHGLQKLGNIEGFGSNLSASYGIPQFMGYVVTAAEFGGGLLLLSGVLVRLGALGHLCVMAVAVGLVHWPTGLMGPGGFEFPLSLLAAAIALLILGPDPLSVDQNIAPAISRSVDVKGVAVKASALLLILAGLSLPLGGNQLGVPTGNVALITAATAGLAAVASGVALLTGRQRAYLPAFVMARLFLGASTLLFLWVKYTVRGAIAVLLSLLMLGALRSARARATR